MLDPSSMMLSPVTMHDLMAVPASQGPASPIAELACRNDLLSLGRIRQSVAKPSICSDIRAPMQGMNLVSAGEDGRPPRRTAGSNRVTDNHRNAMLASDAGLVDGLHRWWGMRREKQEEWLCIRLPGGQR